MEHTATLTSNKKISPKMRAFGQVVLSEEDWKQLLAERKANRQQAQQLLDDREKLKQKVERLRHRLKPLIFTSEEDAKSGFHTVPDIYGHSFTKLRDPREDALFFELAQPLIENRISLLYYDRLWTLYQALKSAMRLHAATKSERPFTMVEAGVYRGGGSAFMAGLMQRLAAPGQDLKLYSVDPFTGHEAADFSEGINDGIHEPDMFGDTSYEVVRELLAPYPFAEVIQARIQDAADARFKEMKFDFLHLDMDIYHPTLDALHFFTPRLAPGASVVIDDYGFTSCPGIPDAVDKFVASNPGAYHQQVLMTGQCLLVAKHV